MISENKRLKSHILLLFFVIILAGCSKAPVRPDVEGLWRLERITVLSTGETVQCGTLYYGITRLVTELSRLDGSRLYGEYISRTSYQDDETTLVLSDFKVRGGTSDTGEDAPVEGLLRYGIDSRLETRFRIVRCDGSTMTLQSDYSRLELKKF